MHNQQISFKEPVRFWSKVDVGDPNKCWEWLASKYESGYGAFEIHYKMWRAHRVAWVLTYGPIPEGLYVLHKCDNPICCNPYHMFLGNQTDNMTDATRKGHTANLTEDEVLEIRELHATGEWTQQELADGFEVHNSTISDVVRRESWAWLEEDV